MEQIQGLWKLQLKFKNKINVQMEKGLNNFKLKHKIWLESVDGTSILGDGKYILLKTIEEEGSFVAAIKKLKLSYRKTWNKMKEIEQKLGFPLLETKRGGNKGGSSILTSKAKTLINAFDNFHKKVDEIIKNAFIEFNNEIRQSDT
jgi:molybdate transport system regulatory protein